MSALFSDFNLSDKLLKSIEDTGFTQCTPIQEQALSYTLQGNDLFAQSQTGTGKTAAFLISIFEIIQRSEYREQALILCPTRELAVQIEAEARLLSAHLDYSMLAIFGGVGYDEQEQALRSPIDLVVGTPGRIIDLSNKGILQLKDFTIGVIDEADRMFDMGFVADIRKIFSRMPKKDVRQTMLFSATLDYSIKRLAEEYTYDAMEVTIEPETTTVTKISQLLYHVGAVDKFKLLLGMIEKHNAPRMIIFSNTKRMCEEISGRLNYCGIHADFLTGDLPQKKRQRIVDQFKRHEIPVLIATDVAARGIHIDDLELVVNYDIPQHAENYVHRIGRTARAGKSGTALTFACEIFVEYLEPVEAYVKMKIPSTVACDEDFTEDRSSGRNWKHQKKTPGNKPRSQQQRGREQKNRNNYNLKKQHKQSESNAPTQSKKRNVTSSANNPKRNVYTGNPTKERSENRSTTATRLKLDPSDKSKEFDSPSRNPYDRRNKNKGKGKSSQGSQGNRPKSTSNNGPKKKNVNKNASTSKGTQARTNKVQKAPAPVVKKGFGAKVKSMFKR